MQDRTDAALAPDPTLDSTAEPAVEPSLGTDTEEPQQDSGEGDSNAADSDEADSDEADSGEADSGAGDSGAGDSGAGDGTPEAPEPDSEASSEAEAEVGPRSAPRLGPGADLEDDELLRQLTVLIFASPDPLSLARLVDLLGRPPKDRVRTALAALSERLEAAGLPLQVAELKGGHTLMTTPDLAEVVTRLSRGDSVERVSPAALETLAVVAYRQPVTKAEIEAIRGVQAGPILRSLVDRGLIRVVGRADVPGHPLQYGTGRDFLDRFGLGGLGDLPRDAELARD